MTRSRAPQHSLSLKVTAEQKRAFAKRCADAGISQTEMLRRLFERLPEQQPLAAVARDHIALIHQARAAMAAGTPIDAERLDELTESTRELITAIRLGIVG